MLSFGFFLVADTQHKRLSSSVGPSVCHTRVITLELKTQTLTYDASGCCSWYCLCVCIGGGWGEAGGLVPLPTRPQRYCDPASLVNLWRYSILATFYLDLCRRIILRFLFVSCKFYLFYPCLHPCTVSAIIAALFHICSLMPSLPHGYSLPPLLCSLSWKKHISYNPLCSNETGAWV